MHKDIKPKAKKTEPEKVEVEKDKLDKVLDKISKQDEVIEQLKKDNEMLKKVADKSRLQHWHEKNKEERRKVVKIRKYKGLLVLGWTDMLENESYRDSATGQLIAHQKTELILEDNTRKVMTLENVNRFTKEMVEAEVLEETKKDNGRIELKVLTREPEPREIIIDTLFIN